jgi:hypothetical protein
MNDFKFRPMTDQMTTAQCEACLPTPFRDMEFGNAAVFIRNLDGG